jgi:hypothetical protein
MRVSFLLFCLVFLFSGCVSKKVLVQEDLVHEQALVNSKSVQIKKENKVIAYIVLTYLNQVDEKFVDEEFDKFVVGVYTPLQDGFASQIEIVLNEDANTTLVEKLDYENKILEVIPSKNVWNTYYLVQSKKRKSKEIKVTFENEEFDKTSLVFRKDYL